MRTAVLSLSAQPSGGADGAQLAVAGQSVARRQLAFALAAGCTRIVAMGEGRSDEATQLAHVAETGGAAFHRIATMRGLVGITRAGDEVLVLAPGLLPESPAARNLLAGSPAILVFPAEAGSSTGFERIDRGRAWAGALVMPGALMERLADLPPEGEAASALLRIALQGGVKDRAADEAWLADGSWAMVTEANADELERRRLSRLLPTAPRLAPTDQLAAVALRASHRRAMSDPRVPTALTGVVIAALLIGPLLAWLSHPAVGFVLIGLSALSAEFVKRLGELRAAPWEQRGRPWSAAEGWLRDIALTVCGALSIDSDSLHRAFPPLVLIAALRAGRRGSAPNLSSWLSDRGIVALVLAVAAAAGWAEPAIMALGLVILAVSALRVARQND